MTLPTRIIASASIICLIGVLLHAPVNAQEDEAEPTAKETKQFIVKMLKRYLPNYVPEEDAIINPAGWTAVEPNDFDDIPEPYVTNIHFNKNTLVLKKVEHLEPDHEHRLITKEIFKIPFSSFDEFEIEDWSNDVDYHSSIEFHVTINQILDIEETKEWKYSYENEWWDQTYERTEKHQMQDVEFLLRTDDITDHMEKQLERLESAVNHLADITPSKKPVQGPF